VAFDVLQTILDLLNNNWNSANTDSLTPNFIKITDKKRLNYRENQDFVIAQRSIPLQVPAGVGVIAKHLHYNFDLDVRVIGFDQEAHWLNVVAEVDRILDANIKILTADLTIIDADTQRQDLSDKTHNLWRMLIPIKPVKYNTAR